MGNTIVIDLDNSLYAHSVQNDKQIHQKDLDKAIIIVMQRIIYSTGINGARRGRIFLR